MTLIGGIEHVGLCARDTAGLADFYVNALGFTVVFRTDTTPPVLFVKAANGAMIEIMPATTALASQPRQNTDLGMVHLALTVADLDAAMAELGAKGIRFEPIKVMGKNRAVFFRDPEGNILHLIERAEKL